MQSSSSANDVKGFKKQRRVQNARRVETTVDGLKNLVLGSLLGFPGSDRDLVVLCP